MRIRALIAAASVVLVLTACAAAPAPVGDRPELDAAIVATQEDFASSLTTVDDEAGLVSTVITLQQYRYGVTAAMVDDAIALIVAEADAVDADAELRIDTHDGEVVSVKHLEQYLDVTVDERGVLQLGRTTG